MPMRMRHMVLCSLHGSATFFHIIPFGQDFRKKTLLKKKMCVLIFSTMFIRKNFLFEEQLSEIPSKVYIGLHVNYPLLLSDFNES